MAIMRRQTGCLVIAIMVLSHLSDAFTPGLPILASNKALLQRHVSAPRRRSSVGCLRGSAGKNIGDEVQQIEMNNALDPRAHSLTERLDHTVHDIQDLYDIITDEIALLEVELRSKKHSQTMLKKRMEMLRSELSSAATEDLLAKGHVTAALIVGGGRVGQFLYDNGNPGDVVVRSTSEYKYHLKKHPGGSPAKGPIYLCVHNEQLPELIAATPEDRKEDLVYMGTYTHEEMQQIKGGTIAAVYFQVVKLGAAPEDPVSGLTTVHGKWAVDFGSRLKNGNVHCRIGSEEELAISQLMYKVWICAVHVVGRLNNCMHVVEVEKKHSDEFHAMLKELGSAAEKKEGITLPKDHVDVLIKYTANCDARVAVHPSRNSYFWEISQDALLHKQPDPCPLHTQAFGKIKSKHLEVKQSGRSSTPYPR